MDYTKLIKEIHKQVSNKTELKLINHGGCGPFALMVGESSDKLNIPYTINIIKKEYEGVIFDRTFETFKKINNNKSVGCWDKEDLRFIHCYISVVGHCFDAKCTNKGTDDTLGYGSVGNYAMIGVYSLHELRIALKYVDWNSTFNRNNIIHIK